MVGFVGREGLEMLWDMEEESDVERKRFKVTERYCMCVFGLGGGDVNVHDNSQMVGNREVS